LLDADEADGGVGTALVNADEFVADGTTTVSG
jgi:hypothetical protein